MIDNLLEDYFREAGYHTQSGLIGLFDVNWQDCYITIYSNHDRGHELMNLYINNDNPEVQCEWIYRGKYFTSTINLCDPDKLEGLIRLLGKIEKWIAKS